MIVMSETHMMLDPGETPRWHVERNDVTGHITATLHGPVGTQAYVSISGLPADVVSCLGDGQRALVPFLDQLSWDIGGDAA